MVITALGGLVMLEQIQTAEVNVMNMALFRLAIPRSQERRTPGYTTCWADMPVARA